MSTELLDYAWYNREELATARALRAEPGLYLVVHDEPTKMFGVRPAATLQEPSMFPVIRRIVNIDSRTNVQHIDRDEIT